MATTPVNTPSELDPTPSALCHRQMTPHRLTEAFVDILRQHFADPLNISDPRLRNLRYRSTALPAEQQAWSQRTSTSLRPSIFIDSATRWDPRATEQRPAVLILPGDYKSQRISIGNKRMPAVAVPWGQEHRSQLMIGQHQVTCVANDQQCALLADECYFEFSEFSEVIRAGLKLLRFEVSPPGSPFRVKEAPDVLGVTLTLGIILEHAWITRVEEPLIDDVVTIDSQI